MAIDPRFRDDFEELFRELGLLDFESLMRHDGYFTEPPMYTHDPQIAFLDGLTPGERDRVLVRAAVGHLGRILDFARDFYAGRDFDFFCAVTVTGWEFHSDQDPLMPRFWYANPSRGVLQHLRLEPPVSDGSSLVAEFLDHDPMFVLNDDVDRRFGEERLERVFVQRADCTVEQSR